ncbi:MAG: acetylxylan esterase [Armatimonadota bacterium]
MLAALLTLAAGCAPAQEDATLEIAQDPEDGICAVGEQATFTVRLVADGRPARGEVGYELTLDGARRLDAGTVQVGAEPGVIAASLDEPGVVRCKATYTVEGNTQSVLAGVAFSPERIEPTATEPPDFDEWWAQQRALLAATPVDAQVEERDPPQGVRALYKVSLATIEGRRVHGWLAVPEGEGPAPAVIAFSGAGVSGISPAGAVGGALQGFLSMHIIHHDFDVEIPAERAAELKAGELAGYTTLGRESRETYYFRYVILGCLRAIDFLASRPEWDGQTLICTGSSQGGGLSLIAAGLHEQVSALAANVPGLCDHTGRFFGRPSGWPRLIPSDDPNDPVAQVAPYYDAVNCARRFHGPALLMVGLIDGTCPPMTVYSAYNVLDGPKQMLVFPRMGHAIPPEWSDHRWQWLRQQAGLE